MLGLLAKKRITDAQVANLFVNATLEAVEKGWPVVAQYIQDCPEFVRSQEVRIEPSVCHPDDQLIENARDATPTPPPPPPPPPLSLCARSDDFGLITFARCGIGAWCTCLN